MNLRKNECLMKSGLQFTFIPNSELQPIEKPIKENRGGSFSNDFHQELVEKRKK